MIKQLNSSKVFLSSREIARTGLRRPLGICQCQNLMKSKRMEWMANIKDLFHSYDQRSHWSWEIDRSEAPTRELVCPCDIHGYVLSKLEIEYSWINSADWRHTNHVLSKSWLSYTDTGNVVLDHALIFERKAYDGSAKRQIESWAKINPVIGKLLQIKPLWGFSLSLDHADAEGNVFEVYHVEQHGHNIDRIESAREHVSSLVIGTDWDMIARKMLALRDRWQGLPLLEQRKWRNDYVNGQ